MTRRVPSVLCLVVALGLLVAVPETSAAGGGSAPVTTPDAVATYPGNLATVRPLRNDSDPEGDRLTICGVGPERYAGITAHVFEDLKDFDIRVRARATPGTYTFTYYACDDVSSTPGSITLTVHERPRITVRKVPGNPGTLRVTNGARFAIRFLYGDYTKDDAEGDFRMPKKSSVVITTRYTRIDWFAFAMTPRGSGDEVGRGHVRHIPRPRLS